MYLSDRDIIARLEQGDLVIDPLEDPEMQIQPASVDLRLGDEFRCWYPAQRVLDVSDGDLELESKLFSAYGTEAQPRRHLVLDPGDFCLATTIERVEIPNDLLARVEGRSSLGRLGLAIHVTAGFIDPGFRGRITLELANLNRYPIRIYPGMRICQLSICHLQSPCLRPYGCRPGSKYQDQGNVIASRINRDLVSE